MGQATMLDTVETTGHLRSGTKLLRGQYEIERSIGQGGFGITYLARDSLNRHVVVKECFQSEMCARHGNEVQTKSASNQEQFASLLVEFQAEARRLAALDHPGIVLVHQVFAENKTAYLAMELLDGVDLMTMYETEPEKVTPEVVQKALLKVLDAVRYMHCQGIMHRDIAPDNLVLGPENQVTLIDFGSANTDYHELGQPGAKILAVKDGFSPHEFYTHGREQHLCSDLYSLGATFYFFITGIAPPNSKMRMDTVSAGQADPYVPLLHAGWEYDPRILETIDLALSLKQQDRVQSTEEWLERLSGPMPARKIQFDPNLPEILANLVKKTNSSLIRDKAKPQNGGTDLAEQKADAQKKPKGPKEYVDIFGNPIKDVEAFLREQDKLCRERTTKEQRPESVQKKARERKPKICGDQTQPSATAVGKLIERFRSNKRDAEPYLFQT